MKYLSPEIEAWSRQQESQSLVRPGVSCGIFQDCNSNTYHETQNYQQKYKANTK
ncbi:hypothetical protein [Formosa sediminum]|uniref:hypothetical protein n=1 Tax=Formosa sediminum TaxID=2594004 RepID=UPI00163D670A|nr:hypothetical protein [Formosa sediminum]